MSILDKLNNCITKQGVEVRFCSVKPDITGLFLHVVVAVTQPQYPMSCSENGLPVGLCHFAAQQVVCSVFMKLLSREQLLAKVEKKITAYESNASQTKELQSVC